MTAKTIRVGIYPGTFDPITNGHIDIVRRASKLVDHLLIAVALNADKRPLFNLQERVEMVQEAIDEIILLNQADEFYGKIEAKTFDSLLIHFAQSRGANVIIRGLRAISDFESEFQMAGMNARLNPKIETTFLMASDRHQFTSSRFVKEISKLGGEISEFVSASVAKRLMHKFNKELARII
ncbi:pantetheine-phosphate adenylyltransferase [Candidatus Endolissoclinum faulkneri L2]|uniref:Phosphopantetheine adenylyltransferase n=1 Tax=Candidatus Endolissoclinum faulkneri L2 TaxID=1193729 RepID=K7YP48_9PROT|nr:pantetheine-phosphate adenylyltransferase [Candidatus Endolissoclinum faulkneri]AFX98364.1 pantetheine-phosphate adenylyltransferase [Candidatus Endolissoclinum faulkneri L2]